MLEFPSPVLSINSSDLYDLIRDHCGQEIVDLILAQKIYDVQTLLRVENVFAIIDLPTNHYRDLKEKVAIQLLDGTWSVFVGLQARVDYFMTSLKQQAKSEETAGADTSHSASSVDRITVSKATIENFPVLGALITFFSKMENCPTMENYTPITSLIKSISTNLIRSKNNYRYSDYVYQFAVALFIYAGQNAYRMMSLNIPGLLPSTTTIRKILRKTSFRMNEADFRFDEMVKYFTILDTRYAFGAEDCTSAVVKVIYDSQSNAFIGFDTPIESGKPLSNAHRTDSFAELKSWFEEKRKATLINIHMVQPLFNSASHRFSAPFFLSSYGIDGKYAADVVLDRYLWIYNESKRNGIRMLGFSSDADPRFMRAMRVASGLFICNPDQRFVTHPDVFEVDVCQWKWFLIRSKQLCVFMQDAVHLCTKLRNRLLSQNTKLILGNEIISTLTLTHMISTKSKLSHGLVYSDVRPRDKQNFSSCQKICSEQTIKLVQDSMVDTPGGKGMIIYLRLMQSVMTAYYERNIRLLDRLHNCWLSVFICRLWWIWLNSQPRTKLKDQYNVVFDSLRSILSKDFNEKIKMPKEPKKSTTWNFFISIASYLSIELNAHSLTYLVLLAIDGKIPWYVLSIDRFNSQSCENIFRLARAMTGVSSTMVNFTVYDFLRRADKISLLQSIKTENQNSINGNSIRFPNHHKHMKNNDGAVGLTSSNDLIQRHDIERVVNEAFIASRALVEPLIGEDFFHQNEITSPMDLSKHVGKLFSSTTFRKKSSEQTNRKNCSFEVVNDGPDGDENEDGNDDGESEEESEDECENEDENDDDENENDNDDDESEEENEDGNEEDDDDQYEDKQTDKINSDDDQETECIVELVLDCSDASFNGMRVKETIETPKSFTYFEVRRRNDTKNVFIHKQTAAWLLSNEKTSLSSDRLKRVTQR